MEDQFSTSEFLTSPAANVLCEQCQDLVRRAFVLRQASREDESTDRRLHHSSSESFFAAAAAGCRICDIVLKCHLRAGGTPDDDFVTRSTLRQYITPGVSIDVVISRASGIRQPIMFDECFSAKLYTGQSWIYGHLRNSCRQEPLPASMDDPSVLELAARWLKSCTTQREDHYECIVPDAGVFQPVRLLDIRSDSIHLSLRSERATGARYCTLSYCWGVSGNALLTTSNEKDFAMHIPLETLPRTITDAIHVARALGFDYIWIDTLCIIQRGDDGVDWARHAKEMSAIYTNGIVNISADRASSVTDGFLGQRAWTALRPIFCGAMPGSAETLKSVIAFRNVPDIALATEPLGSRAWVFSERRLSPRTLHFAAGEMFWECDGLSVASESCPDGYGAAQSNVVYGSFDVATRRDEADKDHQQFDINYWARIVKSYALLSLTKPDTDKLVALAGVARQFEKLTWCTVVAGLLKESLPQSLLWERDTVFNAEVKRSTTYRAPSWSWASLDGPLHFPRLGGGLTNLAKVLDVWTTAVEGHDRFGRIEDGAITLRGPSWSLDDLYRKPIAYRWPNLDIVDEAEASRRATAIILSMYCAPEKDTLHALLIVPAMRENAWTRIGTMHMEVGKDVQMNVKKDARVNEMSPLTQELVEERAFGTFEII